MGLLVQRQNIHIDPHYLGSSDLDQDVNWKAKLKCKIAFPLLHKIVSTGEYPKIQRGLMEKKRIPYLDKLMAMFGIGIGNGGLSFMKRENVYNQFYSDLLTLLEDSIAVPGTTAITIILWSDLKWHTSSHREMRKSVLPELPLQA